MAETILRAKALGKQYAGEHGFRDITFDAGAGEIVGVLGPNGAGKTTLIRVLATLLPPDAGEFSVTGVPHTRPREIRSRIGLLPESSGVYGSLTAEETVVYFARLQGFAKAEAASRASALLAEVGLAERARSLVGSYSRGMRQRLGIARALVNDPNVLFLDEPTLGLDPAGQLDLLATIRRIARERRSTVLLCTHQLEDVDDLADRVLILHQGRLVAEGRPDELRSRFGARHEVRVQVPSESTAAALQALARVPGLQARADATRPGQIVVERASEGASTLMAACIEALDAAGVVPLRVEREGTRLSDAFFALTRGEAIA